MTPDTVLSIPLITPRTRGAAIPKHLDEIPVDQVRINLEQPRKYFDEQEMAYLTASVRVHGVLIPILVERDLAGGYILHDGERRWRAAQAAGLITIPARILPPGADRTKLVNALVANLHSASMTIVEEAMAYQRLAETHGYGTTHGWIEKVARLLGISPVRISNAITVLRLPQSIQVYFAARKLPNNPDVVRALLAIPDETARQQLADRLAGLPHPPTITVAKNACGRLRNALADQNPPPASMPAEETRKRKGYAMRYASRKQPRDEWPEWDALYQLGKVPAWPVVNDAVMATCDNCAMRPVASEKTCRECPLVDCLRRMMKAVEK